MTIVVKVTEANGQLVVDKPTVELKGGRDRLKIQNKTTVDLKWTVPEGAFTARGPFTKGVKKSKDGTSPKALKVEFETKYTLQELRARAGYKRRRRAKGDADPVIIIDL